MITLYIKSPCPYSARAIAALNLFNVSFEQKNIADEGIWEEVVALGGRHKVPFLVDGDIQLYESDEIIEYVQKRYGNNGENSDGIRMVRE